MAVVELAAAGIEKVMGVRAESEVVVAVEDHQESLSAVVTKQDLLLENLSAGAVEREDVGRESQLAAEQGLPEGSQAVENSDFEGENPFAEGTDTQAEAVPTET